MSDFFEIIENINKDRESKKNIVSINSFSVLPKILTRKGIF